MSLDYELSLPDKASALQTIIINLSCGIAKHILDNIYLTATDAIIVLDILKLLPLCQARSSKFTMIVQNNIRRCQFVCVWSIRHLEIPLVPITNGLQVCSAYYIKSMSLPSIMTFWPLTIMLSCLIRTPSLYLGGNITRELWWDVILLWYPVWIYMYLKVGTTHVFRLALCNFVLGLTNILLKSKLFKWCMSYGDMTNYGHATIIRVLLGKLI